MLDNTSCAFKIIISKTSIMQFLLVVALPDMHFDTLLTRIVIFDRKVNFTEKRWLMHADYILILLFQFQKLPR